MVFGGDPIACVRRLLSCGRRFSGLKAKPYASRSLKPGSKRLERSPLKPADLNHIPFTLLVPNCPITFMEHKRCVVHIARQSAEAMQEFMGRALPIDMDTVVAGAILADVGKLLEYELGPRRQEPPEPTW